MFCKKCGFNLEKEMNFCPRCGRNVDRVQDKKNHQNIKNEDELWKELVKYVLYYHGLKINATALDKIEEAYFQVERYIIKYNQKLVSQGKTPFPSNENSKYPYDSSIECIANKIIQSQHKDTVCHQNMRSFTSVEQLNNWLKNENGIENLKCDFETSQSIGLFANHIIPKKINVTYIKTSKKYGYRFQVAFIEKTNVMVSGEGKYIEKLKSLNPSKTIISCKCLSTSRGSTSSVAFGFGLDYMEHEAYFIVYREDVFDNRSFVEK